MLSFDDTRKAQYTIAEPVFRKYGFKAAFFIMTVCLDKRDYLSSANLKEFSLKGYCIAAHTYDHPMVSHIENKQWNKELLQPKLLLEKILGRPVDYFAYPYGSWTSEAIRKLKQYGYKAGFQLAGKPSDLEPLFTIRRLMVEGNWTAKGLHKQIVQTFPKTSGPIVASSGKTRAGKND
jgi:peptidoglycan/xylan/chitin deacetylase (PgdA/CDA1 family)